MAKPVTKPAVKKPAAKKRFQDALSLLTSLESVAIAEDKNVSVDAPIQKDNKDDLTGTVTPQEEVSADPKATPVREVPAALSNQTGAAQTVDVAKVKANTSTDQANADEVDSVTNKTADAVKAGEKDLTTGLISTEDAIEASEAEHIEPKEADDAVMNVEQAVEALDSTGITTGSDSALNKAEQVGNDLENFDKVGAALEEFQTILRDIRKKGQKPSPQLARAIQVCLKSHNQTYFRPIIASLEDFARPDSSVAVSISLEASIGGKIKELAAAGKNALARLFEMIIDAWNHLRRDTAQLLTELEKTINAVKQSNLDAGADKSVTGAARLMINGEFVGDSVEVVKNVEAVSRELLVEWPNALIKVIKDLKSSGQEVAKSGDVGGSKGPDNEKIEEIAQTALEATFGKFSEVDSGEAPSSLSSFNIITRSPLLPGNKALFIGIGNGTNASANIAENKTFMKFAFESTGNAEGGDTSVKVPSKERALASLNAVKGIIVNLISKDTSMNALKTLRKDIAPAVTGEYSQGNDVARGAVQAALLQHRMFMGYLTTLIKHYISFYNGVVSKGDKGTTDVAVRENSAAAQTNGKTTDRTKEADDDSVVSTQ